MNIFKLVVIIFCLFFSTISLADGVVTSSQGAEAPSSSIDPIDEEMALLLGLDVEQLHSYSEVMQTQRPAYLAAEYLDWQSRQAVYNDTLKLLQTVVTAHQLSQFSAIMDCLMREETPKQQWAGL